MTRADSGSKQHYDHDLFVKLVAGKIKAMRKEAGYSARRFALEHGFVVQHWQSIEAAETMSLPTLLRIANAFNVPVEVFTFAVPRLPGPGRGSDDTTKAEECKSTHRRKLKP